MKIWRNDFLIAVAFLSVFAFWSEVGGYATILLYILLAGLCALAYRVPEASFTFVLLNGFAIGGFWPGSPRWLLVLSVVFIAFSIQEAWVVLSAS